MAQQTNFAYPGVRQQQFGERAARPAASGQLRIERGKPAGQALFGVAPELVTTPQIGMQGFGRKCSIRQARYAADDGATSLHKSRRGRSSKG